MKELKNIEYKGYNIVINAKFEYDSWHGDDAVKFKIEVLKDDRLIDRKYNTVVAKEKVKFLFWTTQESTTLKQEVESKLKRIERNRKEDIDELIFCDNITDGLIDSLDELER